MPRMGTTYLIHQPRGDRQRLQRLPKDVALFFQSVVLLQKIDGALRPTRNLDYSTNTGRNAKPRHCFGVFFGGPPVGGICLSVSVLVVLLV